MTQRLQKTKTIFTMDKVLSRLPSIHRRNWYWEAKFLQQYLKPRTCVLQIGSCDGIRLDYLAKRRNDISFVGLEIDRALSREASNRFRKHHGRVKSVYGDARKLPFKRETFDYAICLNNTLGYIPDNKKVVAELKRVVKEAGEAIVSVYGKQWTNSMAREYFFRLNAMTVTIKADLINVDGMKVRRYSRGTFQKLIGSGATIIRSPLGYVGIVKKYFKPKK